MHTQTCYAGFARLDITGFLGQHIGGYYVERIAQGVDDPLYVNAVAFRQGERTAVLLVCDLLGIYSDAARLWPRQIASQLGIDEDAVILCCTHSHTTPVVEGVREPSDPMYQRFFLRRIRDAAALAIRDLKPVTDVRAAQGEAPGFAFVRRYYYKDGHFQTWCTDPELVERPGSEGDDSIRLVRILRKGGKEIALTNFQFHPDNIGSCRYSADYPGPFRTHMEQLRDVHCVYLDGAEGQLDGDGGLQVPLPGGHARMTDIGRRLAQAVLPLFEQAASTGRTGLSAAQLFARTKTKRDPARLGEAQRLIALHEAGRDSQIGPSWLSVPLVAEAYGLRGLEQAEQDFIDLPVSAIVFCGAAFVGLPGEPFCELGKTIRASSPFPVTCLCCQANGTMGYLPNAEAFDQGGYEPSSCRFAKGVGELLTDTAGRLLAELNKGEENMKTYTVTRVSGTPDWSVIPALEITETYRHALEDTPVRAWTQVAYNDEALLVRQWATEPNIRRELTGLLDEICEDSCLEFFVCPVEGDRRYFNIEYNFNRSRYLGFGTCIPDLVRLVPEEGDCFEPVTTETANGWELTYQIPYSFIRRFFPDFDPTPGKAMRANCSKCGDLSATPHWLTWNRLPYSEDSFTFHTPDNYGRMIFG